MMKQHSAYPFSLLMLLATLLITAQPLKAELFWTYEKDGQQGYLLGSVHFANETSTAADVIVSAIDDDGEVHGPLDLGVDLAGDTVTKVSQTTIMSLFGLTESAKLSVTFNIDADDGTVNAYAFSNAGDARQALVSSQQKGK